MHLPSLTIKATPAFLKKSAKVMTSEALEELYDSLLLMPESGDVIRGTGGIRKLRWRTGKNNKGKSGGVRVLYHYTPAALILLITLYEKSDKENISQQEKNFLKAALPKLIKECEGT